MRNFNNISCIFGIGNGLRLILLFHSLKSEMNLTVPFFLGIIKVGAAHSELLIFLNTPSFINLSTSNRSAFSCILGIGKALAGYDCAPGCNSMS